MAAQEAVLTDVNLIALCIQRLTLQDLYRAASCSSIWREASRSNAVWQPLVAARFPEAADLLGITDHRALYARLCKVDPEAHKRVPTLADYQFLVCMKFSGQPILRASFHGADALTTRVRAPLLNEQEGDTAVDVDADGAVTSAALSAAAPSAVSTSLPPPSSSPLVSYSTAQPLGSPQWWIDDFEESWLAEAVNAMYDDDDVDVEAVLSSSGSGATDVTALMQLIDQYSCGVAVRNVLALVGCGVRQWWRYSVVALVGGRVRRW